MQVISAYFVQSNTCEVCVMVRNGRLGECPQPSHDMIVDEIANSEWVIAKDGSPLRGNRHSYNYPSKIK